MTAATVGMQVRLEALAHVWHRLVRLESRALAEGDEARAKRLEVRADALAAKHSALVRRVWARRWPL